MANNSADRMGTQPIIPLVISLSVPVMVSLLVNALYNVVDSMYVARYSEHGMTAISLAFPIQTLIVAVGSGTGVGANIMIARRLGEQNPKGASTIASHSILLSFFNWLVFIAVGLFAVRPYFAALSKTPDVINLGVSYTGLVCLLSLGTLLENVASRILLACGDSFRPMAFQITGAVVNIILDPILIFGYLGAPEMGIVGAAIATVIGQFCSMILCLTAVLRNRSVIAVTPSGFRPDLRSVADIYVAGVPTIIMTSLVSFYITGLNAVLVRFSETAVAVLGVYYKLQTFLIMPTNGLNQGCTPVLSYNYGAGNYKRMWQTLWHSLALSSVTLTLGTLVFLLFPRQLLALFSASEEMMVIGIPALRIISLSFPLFGITILMPMLYQATGHNLQNIFVTLFRQVILLVPIAWILSHWGLYYVWFTYPISEVLAALLCLYYTHRLRRGVLAAPDAHKTATNE